MALVFGLALSVQAQSFQNLCFEQASPVVIAGNSYYPDAITPASAFPEWTALIGGVPVTQVFYNDISLDAASVDLLSKATPYFPGVIGGNYSVYLQPGTSIDGTGEYTASIEQTGTIPLGTKTLFFDGFQFPGALPFMVTFNGDYLPTTVVSTGIAPTGQSYDVYGANLSYFAGETGNLEFTVYPGHYNSLLLDNISFSPASLTPEPSVLILFGAGALLLLLRRETQR